MRKVFIVNMTRTLEAKTRILIFAVHVAASIIRKNGSSEDMNGAKMHIFPASFSIVHGPTHQIRIKRNMQIDVAAADILAFYS